MKSARAQFTQHGLRCTKQRLILYETLCACKTHPTADELYCMLRDRFERISLATVYNALEAFSSVGLVRKIPTTNGAMRYDADVSDHLHVRIQENDRVLDVPHDLGRRLIANLPADVMAQIESELGVKIDGVEVQLIGASPCGGD